MNKLAESDVFYEHKECTLISMTGMLDPDLFTGILKISIPAKRIPQKQIHEKCKQKSKGFSLSVPFIQSFVVRCFSEPSVHIQ